MSEPVQFPRLTLNFVVPELWLGWRAYREDSVPYIADTSYSDVSRFMGDLAFSAGVGLGPWCGALSITYKGDIWAGKFGNDINTHLSTGFGDLTLSNALSKTWGNFSAGLKLDYSFPLSSTPDWDTLRPDSSAMGVSYPGGVWRTLSLGSNGTGVFLLGSARPVEVLKFVANLGYSSGRNGDPTDNYIAAGLLAELLAGGFSPFLEYYFLVFPADTGTHSPGPSFLTLGFRLASPGGVGVKLALDFWGSNRAEALDNSEQPDFWFPSWSPQLAGFFGVFYSYSQKEKEKPKGTITGVVMSQRGEPLQGFVSVPEAGVNRQPTGPDGSFSIEGVPEGVFTLIVEAPGFELWSSKVQVRAGEITLVNAFLRSKAEKPEKGVMAGKVFDKLSGKPLKAKVSVSELGLEVETDSATGIFKLKDIPEGLYTLSIEVPGYEPTMEVVAVKAGEPTVKDIALVPKEAFRGAEVSDDKSAETAKMFVEMAQAKASEGNYEEALRYLDIAAVWNPDDPQIQALASQYEERARETAAKLRLEKGVKLYKQGKLLDALVEFDKALALGGGEAAKRWFDKAFGELLKAQPQRNPQVAELVQEATAAFAKEDFPKAESLLTKALSLAPGDPELAKLLQLVISKKAQRVAELVEKAQKALAKGRVSKAKVLARRALRLDPENKRAKAILSQAKSRAVAVAKKREEKTKPLVDQKKVQELYLLGIQAYVNQDYESAIYYWEQVLKLDPNHEKARKNLQRAKKKLGK